MSLKTVILLGCALLITGCTTLHTAASKGNVKAIERLVKEEANIDETDDSGKTPLIYAVIMNQKESVSALLKAGADVNTQSDTGNTALHEAVLQGNIKFASLLLEKGANTALRNKEGKSVMDLAHDHGSQPLIDLLSAHSTEHKHIVIKDIRPTEPSSPSVNVDVIEPIPVISQAQNLMPTQIVKETAAAPVQTAAAVESPKEMVMKQAVPTISNEEATARLRKMIAGRETMGIRSFLNQYPHTINLIDDPMQRIRYVGPSGFRVIDIIENMGRGKISDVQVINQIMTSNYPYKNFSADELKMLSRYGISNSIINAMVNVSK